MTPINQDDLLKLNKSYHSVDSSLHCVYGATQTGKTTFIQDFIVKKNFLYFNAVPAINQLQYANFVNQINKKFKLKNSTKLYDSFTKVLQLLEEQDINEKMVFIFDNFQELIKNEKNALEILLKLWKKTFKSKKHPTYYYFINFI
jgi:predicted AAA+ superfamily ATPase